MKRKELIKTFMMISTLKNPFNLHGSHKNISGLIRLPRILQSQHPPRGGRFHKLPANLRAYGTPTEAVSCHRLPTRTSTTQYDMAVYLQPL